MEWSTPAPPLRSGGPRSKGVVPLLGEGPDRLPSRGGTRWCTPEDGRARREGVLRGGEGSRRALGPPWEPPLAPECTARFGRQIGGRKIGGSGRRFR